MIINIPLSDIRLLPEKFGIKRWPPKILQFQLAQVILFKGHFYLLFIKFFGSYDHKHFYSKFGDNYKKMTPGETSNAEDERRDDSKRKGGH